MTTTEEPRGWEEYVAVAKAYIAKRTIEIDELNDKREIGRELEAVRKALFDGEDTWRERLERVMRREPRLVYVGTIDYFCEWINEGQIVAVQALQTLWAEERISLKERIDGFMSRLPPQINRREANSVTNLVSVLLMGLDVEKYPPFSASRLVRAYRRTGYGEPDSYPGITGRYEHLLAFLDRFIEEAGKQGVELPNRLYAHSVVWQIDRLRIPTDANYPAVSQDPWDEYVERASNYISKGTIQENELDYKLDMANDLADAQRALLSGASEWPSTVERATRKISGNPVDYRIVDDFNIWLGSDPEAAGNALSLIWTQQDVSLLERISAFGSVLPENTRARGGATVTSLASTLLMALDPKAYPPYKYTELNNAYERTGFSGRDGNMDVAKRYEHALSFLDRFIREAAKRGLHIPDRLYAQSVIFSLERNRDQVEAPLPDIEDSQDDAVNPPQTLQALADSLYLPVGFLENIVALLEDKKQVIFQGPPGTGKTHVAQELAEHLAGSGERVTLVQFHPSYSYEDFVQGIRPKLDDEQARFELRNGPLYRVAKQAEADANANYYLIIDEINRGNIANVFGELYFLLDYRDRKINLQYDDRLFKLPPNLYIIGTMNTADRSIALIDTALRRRFYFVEFHPDHGDVRDVLREFLRRKHPDMEWVADVVDAANAKLAEDRHAAIGPSYFMNAKGKLTDKVVERIWKHSVIPYIEERRFRGEQVTEEFSLDRLRREADTNTAQPDDQDAIPDAESDAT